MCAFPCKADIENVPENLQTALICSVVDPQSVVKKSYKICTLNRQTVFLFFFYPPPCRECDCIVQRRKYLRTICFAFSKNERDKKSLCNDGIFL